MAAEQLVLDLGEFSSGLVSRFPTDTDYALPLYKGFRHRGTTAKEMSAAYHAADKAWRQAPIAWEPPRVSITGTSRLPPEHSAVELRSLLHLSTDEPVPSMVNVLRDLGCIVAAMPDERDHLDGFSCWFDDTPVVLLRKDGGRREVRFEAAHELGHLVMHKGHVNSAVVEREANAFARAFLLPVDICTSLGFHPFQWDSVRVLADTCSIDLLSSLKRIHDLGLISGKVYRAAMIDASRRGWRSRSPHDEQVPERIC